MAIRNDGDVFVAVESLEARLVLASNIAMVGFEDVFNGSLSGTSLSSYAIEGSLNNQTSQLSFQEFASGANGPTTSQPETAPFTLEASTGRISAQIGDGYDRQFSSFTGGTGQRTGWFFGTDNGTPGLQDNSGDSDTVEFGLWVERPFTAGLSDLDGSWQFTYYQWSVNSTNYGTTFAGGGAIDNGQMNFEASSPSLSQQTILLSGNLQSLDTRGKFELSQTNGQRSWLYLSGDTDTLIGVNLDSNDGNLWVLVANRVPVQGGTTAFSYAGAYNVSWGLEDAFVDDFATDEFAADTGVLTLTPTSATGGNAVFTSDQRGFTVGGVYTYDSTTNVLAFEVNADGEIIRLSFYGSDDGNTLITFLDQEIAGGQVTTNGVFGFASRIDPSGTINPAEAPEAVPMMTADEFVAFFRSSFGEGLSDGNRVADILRNGVGGAAYSQADWTAENYWFQDSTGNVFSLWHGGPVHVLPDGQYTWVLTNLADAAGLTGEIDFAPGSLSGVIASWRAFSIQGVSEGRLVSLWWSPESLNRQFGLRQNGWVLTPFDSNIFRDPSTGEAVSSVPTFLNFSETQSNGRFTFDPRVGADAQDGGMSVVLVDTLDQVYVVTFTTTVQAVGVPAPERPNIWLLERFEEVPSIERFGLSGDVTGFAQAFINRARA